MSNSLVADFIAVSSEKPSTNSVQAAVSCLKSNGVIIMPSDTLYGFFCAFTTAGVAKLIELKKRPPEKPFLLVIPENYPLDSLIDFSALTARAKEKIRGLWPGKNTLVLPKNKALEYPPGESIALRTPLKADNPFFYEVLKEFNAPLLAPSLNLHGFPPMQEKEKIMSEFSEHVDAIFFDESFLTKAPSNIWDLTAEPFSKLR